MSPIIKKPSLPFALCVLGTIVTAIGGAIAFKVSVHMAMLTAWLICAAYATRLGYTYTDLEESAVSMIGRAMKACIILIAVGALIGSWISSGTVAVMIYSGLALIKPNLFLVTSVLLCSATSLTVGTSWGTIGTVGLALMAVGTSMGIPPGITAGSIICGAYFGDKLSPLSDTTNIAAGALNVDLVTHIKHMFYTAFPAYIITLVIFTVIGFKYGGAFTGDEQLENIMRGLESNFTIDIVPVIPMVVVFFLLASRKNPVVSIMTGALLGVLIAVFHGGVDFSTAFNSMWKGFEGQLSDPLLTKLLNRGGAQNMLGIMAFLMLASGLGGMLKRIGVLDVALAPILKRVNSDGQLVLASLFTGYSFHIMTASTHLSCILMETTLEPLYKKRGLKLENCTRVAEDCCTFGGPLIPWTPHVLFITTMLGVSWTAFAPWCFLLFLTPIVSIIYGYSGITMTREVENGPDENSEQVILETKNIR